MQFYLILSNFYSSFVFIFSPPSPSDSDQSGIPEHVVRRGRNTLKNNITHGCRGGRRWFLFSSFRPTHKAPLPLPNACYCCCRRYVGGGGSGCCRPLHPCLPHRPLLRYLPRPRHILSANSNLPPATRALQLRTRPHPHPWPRPPPKIRSSTIPPPPRVRRWPHLPAWVVNHTG